MKNLIHLDKNSYGVMEKNDVIILCFIKDLKCMLRCMLRWPMVRDYLILNI